MADTHTVGRSQGAAGPRAAAATRTAAGVPDESRASRDACPDATTAASAKETPATFSEAAAYFFRSPSPLILSVALVAASGARIAQGGVSLWDLLPPLVVLAHWPLNEWLIHVFVLHAKPRRIGRFRFDPPVPRSHRAHHRDPWRLDLVFIPLHSYLYTLPILVLACWALTPTRALALTALVAYLTLALHYEWVHFLAHTRVRPRSAHYRQLIRNHRLHHFRNERYWYGVSMLAADRPLRTAPGLTEVPVSATARTLGVTDLENGWPSEVRPVS